LDGRYLAGLDRLVGSLAPSVEEPQPLPFVFTERFGPLDDELEDYLAGRNPYLLLLAPVLGLRGWYGRDKGVVVPFWYREALVKFQTRFLYKTDPKYYTSIGQKPFYSPHQLFKPRYFDRQAYEEITLCEGVFDAIALACMGYAAPLAMLGKTVSEFQVHLLRLLSPRCLVAALDERQLSKDLAIRLRQHRIPSVEEVKIRTPWSRYQQDPEEYMVHLLTVHPDKKQFRRQCEQCITRWIGGV
jgi:hypothetical protein